ncbi:MAG: Ubiquitin-like protein pup [Candidatus Saccharibacteria bacterium]|nr:Ubiquitin-like protein pup [Candidatus Saccharibacteria bacterium]
MERMNQQPDQPQEEILDELPTEVNETTSKLADDVDTLLDEIDDVLEENAEDFVKGYIQKGGQ